MRRGGDALRQGVAASHAGDDVGSGEFMALLSATTDERDGLAALVDQLLEKFDGVRPCFATERGECVECGRRRAAEHERGCAVGELLRTMGLGIDVWVRVAAARKKLLKSVPVKDGHGRCMLCGVRNGHTVKCRVAELERAEKEANST